MLIKALTAAVLVSSAVTALWGLFHQFIVGGALSAVRNCDDRSARLLLTTWIAQGAFLTLCGALPLILLLLHGLTDAVRLMLLLVGLALTLLSAHVAVIGLRRALPPVRLGWVLQSVHAVLLLALYLASA